MIIHAGLDLFGCKSGASSQRRRSPSADALGRLFCAAGAGLSRKAQLRSCAQDSRKESAEYLAGRYREGTSVSHPYRDLACVAAYPARVRRSERLEDEEFMPAPNQCWATVTRPLRGLLSDRMFLAECLSVRIRRNLSLRQTSESGMSQCAETDGTAACSNPVNQRVSRLTQALRKPQLNPTAD